MWTAFALHFVQEVLALTVPLLTSWMIGDMADALLRLDIGRIRGRLQCFRIQMIGWLIQQKKLSAPCKCRSEEKFLAFSGKSTLLRVILGLLPADSGSILVDLHNISFALQGFNRTCLFRPETNLNHAIRDFRKFFCKPFFPRVGF
mgnify:CR=1 FL=1